MPKAPSLHDPSRLVREILESNGPEQFHARVTHQAGGTLEEFHVEVDQVACAWFMHRLGSDLVVEHVDGQTFLPEGPQSYPFAEPVPWPMHFAFPEVLTHWGRPGDEFEPVFANEIGNHSILVTVQHLSDPAVRGTVVFDRTFNLIRKVITPFGITQIDDVEAGVGIARDRSRRPSNAGFVRPKY